MKIRDGWLSKKTIVESCGVTRQAFESWGVEPIGKQGRQTFYTIESVLENRLTHHLQKQAKRAIVDPSKINDPVAQLKARKTEQEIIGLELKNAVLEGRSLPTEVVTHVLTKFFSLAVSIFETLPLEVTRKYPTLEPRVIRHIEKSIAAIRNEAATLPDQLDDILDEFISEAEDRIN